MRCQTERILYCGEKCAVGSVTICIEKGELYAK